jgi:hypothetical protein
MSSGSARSAALIASKEAQHAQTAAEFAKTLTESVKGASARAKLSAGKLGLLLLSILICMYWQLTGICRSLAEGV